MKAGELNAVASDVPPNEAALLRYISALVARRVRRNVEFVRHHSMAHIDQNAPIELDF
ncbi:MAG TPA: hypothetical protein VMT08_07470 [Bradyrhizobium sp.]|nr:hypothetical protein [Bradyrhizobium sp.]